MKKTVIIADDNAVLVADLKEFFASVNDYDVVAVAENGKEALAAIEKFDPDFLLLDIVMPELDGFGVLSALTKPRPTVIMMSQLNTDAFVQKALRYGAKYFLAKLQSPSTSGCCSALSTTSRRKTTRPPSIRAPCNVNPSVGTAPSTRRSQTSSSP